MVSEVRTQQPAVHKHNRVRDNRDVDENNKNIFHVPANRHDHDNHACHHDFLVRKHGRDHDYLHLLPKLFQQMKLSEQKSKQQTSNGAMRTGCDRFFLVLPDAKGNILIWHGDDACHFPSPYGLQTFQKLRRHFSFAYPTFGYKDL